MDPWLLRVIVAASLFFYGWWSPKFVLLLGGSIVANYALGRLTLRAQGRYWLVTGIAANLALLGWFKFATLAFPVQRRVAAQDLSTGWLCAAGSVQCCAPESVTQDVTQPGPDLLRLKPPVLASCTTAPNACSAASAVARRVIASPC